jgi:hypothetical protein
MPPMGPRRLGAADRAVLAALLPAGVSRRLPQGVLDTGFDAFLGEFEVAAPPDLRRAFGLALFAAAWLSPLLIRRLPPISRLGAGDREVALAAMERSRLPELRQLVRVLKTVVSLHYGALPQIRQAIGYHS